jgi:uncharacterized protein Veg
LGKPFHRECQNSGILLETHITKFVVSFSKFKGQKVAL